MPEPTGYHVGMFIRPCYRTKNGKRHAYWALVESQRTKQGPRQRVVAYLGELDKAGRLGIEQAAEDADGRQRELWDDVEPRWVEVDASRMRVENCRAFGGPWLVLELVRELGLDRFLAKAVPPGREDVPWPLVALVLVVSRICEPSSELHVTEHFYPDSALADLLGVPPDKVNDDRVYRALDAVLPHKVELETFLKNRMGDLFGLSYDLLLYDVTSTYFEGEAAANPMAQRGYSRDHRPDTKQVCIALVVSKCGMPLGYEVFAGNRTDVTTLREIVETMEGRYGQADRIWAVDRGMVSEANIDFLKSGGRRYIVGTPRSALRRYERELLSDDWDQVRDGLEVKLVPSPDGDETFVLCRSRDRREKEKAMHARFEQRIETGLREIEASCSERKCRVAVIAKRLGKLLGRNSRAAGLFATDVVEDSDGRARLVWNKAAAWRDWAALSEGCYLLRSNIIDWNPEDLWTAYIQLTEAEAAFRIQKSDLRLRPIWHQKPDRVLAHILVCFLAYVVWKTLAMRCRAAGLGDEPRRVFAELGRIRVVDVLLPTRTGICIRKRCVTRPTEHQALLLQRLGLPLPERLKMTAM